MHFAVTMCTLRVYPQPLLCFGGGCRFSRFRSETPGWWRRGRSAGCFVRLAGEHVRFFFEVKKAEDEVQRVEADARTAKLEQKLAIEREAGGFKAARRPLGIGAEDGWSRGSAAPQRGPARSGYRGNCSGLPSS